MAAGLVATADSPGLIITSEPEAAALTAKQHKDLLGLQTGAQQCFGACERSEALLHMIKLTRAL
jgi:hypothetical protein